MAAHPIEGRRRHRGDEPPDCSTCGEPVPARLRNARTGEWRTTCSVDCLAKRRRAISGVSGSLPKRANVYAGPRRCVVCGEPTGPVSKTTSKFRATCSSGCLSEARRRTAQRVLEDRRADGERMPAEVSAWTRARRVRAAIEEINAGAGWTLRLARRWRVSPSTAHARVKYMERDGLLERPPYIGEYRSDAMRIGGGAVRDGCPTGHTLDGLKSDGSRYCKTCHRERERERYRRSRGLRPQRFCAECAEPIDPNKQVTAKHCSESCRRKSARRRQAGRSAR